MKQCLRACMAFTLSAVCWTAQAAPLPGYKAVPILTVGARAADVSASGINNQGALIGILNPGGGYYGFVDRGGGALSWLPTLGGSISGAGAINHAGDIVYQSETASGSVHATLARNGQAIDLAPDTGTSTFAFAVSQSGRWIAGGISCLECGGYSQAALFSDTGGVQNLGTLGGNSSRALGVNDAGQVVGFSSVAGSPSARAFIYENGVMRDLGGFGGAATLASAINQAGQIVGSADDASGMAHAFLYEDGVMRDLGTLFGGRPTAATAINDSGLIVGVGSTGAGGGAAFVWRDGVMTALDELLDPSSGWAIDDAQGINDFGQIAAHGCNRELNVCAILRLDPLVPVPEPAAAGMLAAGLALMGAAVRRRRR
jgi:probable HAF family extracellular repeat protein